MNYTKKFNEKEAEYNLKELKMTHSFALKMASIITTAVMFSILISCFAFGTINPILIIVATIAAIFFGAIVFSFTRSACLA